MVMGTSTDGGLHEKDENSPTSPGSPMRRDAETSTPVPYRVALDTFGSEEVQPGKAVFDSGRLTMGFDTRCAASLRQCDLLLERGFMVGCHPGLQPGALERAFASLQEL